MIVLVMGVAVGVVFIQKQQSVQVTASPELTPRNITISNIQSDSFTVSWTTDAPTLGFIVWGTGNSPSSPSQEIGEGQKTAHTVKVKNLQPETDYSFRINSGGGFYGDGTNPWLVATGPELTLPTSSKVISGTIETQSGDPQTQAIVTVSSSKISPLSTITTSSGNWVIPLSLARESDLNSYAKFNSDDLIVNVLAGTTDKATAIINSSYSGSLPTIVIGHAHDFTNLSLAYTDATLRSELDLPSEDVLGTTDSSVTLESVDNGEVVFTNVPEFFGEGPAGSEIKITVHSDPISGTTTVEDDGEWNWSPLEAIENGLHNITIEWIDDLGIIHTLTRSFIVQAQEGEPSFESTPSGSTSPSSTPSPTPSPSPTPKPSATVKPSTSPTPTSTSSGNLPDAGSTTPSVLLAAVGFVTLSLGAFFTIKKS